MFLHSFFIKKCKHVHAFQKNAYFCNCNQSQKGMRTGIFVGTFNPFTLGHDNIVRRALTLADRIVIGVVADNVNKPGVPTADERMEPIRQLYAGDSRVEVKTFSGLAVDFARAEKGDFIVKGVRNVKDFEYEREQAEWNCRLTGIETILLIAEPNLSSLSSSTLRELQHFGVDITPYLPTPNSSTI